MSAQAKPIKQAPERIRLTHAEWSKKGTELFGPSPRKWKFKCPRCGHVQSGESVLEHNPSLDILKIRNWIYYSCEGRHNKEHGCDWTLGGLFQIHRVEVVLDDGHVSPVFEFAETEAVE